MAQPAPVLGKAVQLRSIQDRLQAPDCVGPAYLPFPTAMSSTLPAMCLFALVGAITPGPVNVLALRHGAGFVRLAFLVVVGALILKTGVDAWLR